MDDRFQLFSGQRAFNCLAEDVPGAARFFVDDLVSVGVEG